jgi:hypothetical protein
MTDRQHLDAPRRQRTRLAGGLLLATIVLEATTLGLVGLAPADRVAAVALIGFLDGLLSFATWLAFAVVGWLIIRRQPENLIGWMCLYFAFGVSLIAVVTGIATYLLAVDSESLAGQLAGWVAHSATLGVVALPVFVFLRFPTGRPVGRWFALFERLSIALVASLVPVVALAPIPLLGFPTTPNPLAVGDMPIAPAVSYVTIVVLLLLIVAAASLVQRYRRGSPLERRQIAVLGAAAALVVLDFGLIPFTSPAILSTGRLSAPTQIVTALSMTAIPVAIGIAIARYRLFEIDRIVNRTLVYATVSAVLAGVYVLAVVVLQAPLGAIFPDDARTLATAGSTLLVAALFRPVRARAQRTIDRRFDRERFQAARTIDAFAEEVRNEVELDAILRDFLAATARTVHPATAACWIRSRMA